MTTLPSIVHEYAVLYTTRLHQKDKRWCDGVLKFYEFNNKIEVCNSDGNIITSDFYPKNKKSPLVSNAFASGIQYTLPNSRVLVEFDEYLSSYKRDISKMFKKEKQSIDDGDVSYNAIETPPLKTIYSFKPVKPSNHTPTPATVKPPISKPSAPISRPTSKPSVSKPTSKPPTKPPSSTSPSSLPSLAFNNILHRRRIGLSKVKKENDPYLSSLISYRPNTSARVPARSSKYFQHLEGSNVKINAIPPSQLKRSVEPMTQGTNLDTNPRETPFTPRETVPSSHTSKNVGRNPVSSHPVNQPSPQPSPESDDVNDDFNDDEEFFAMLSKVRNDTVS